MAFVDSFSRQSPTPYTPNRPSASGGYSSGRGMASGGYSPNRSMASGGYSTGRSMASGGYSAGRSMASGSYGQKQMASTPGMGMFSGGSSSNGGGGGSMFGGIGGALTGALGGLGKGQQGRSMVMPKPHVMPNRMNGSYGIPNPNRQGNQSSGIGPSQDPYHHSSLPGTAGPSFGNDASGMINQRNPHASADMPFVQQGNTGGYLDGVGVTIGEGRSTTPAQYQAQISQAEAAGVPSNYIQDFLRRNPGDSSRILSGYASENGGQYRDQMMAAQNQPWQQFAR